MKHKVPKLVELAIMGIFTLGRLPKDTVNRLVAAVIYKDTVVLTDILNNNFRCISAEFGSTSFRDIGELVINNYNHLARISPALKFNQDE